MDAVNARAHCTDVFDRFSSVVGGNSIPATIYVDDAAQRGILQILSTHVLLIDDVKEESVLLSIDLDHVHSIKRYQEVLFPNRTFAEMPRFRTTVELFVTGSGVHRLIIDGEHASRVGHFLELLWRFHYGKLSTRMEAMCRGFHLGDALFALSLLPFDMDCFLVQQIQGSTVVNVEKPLVLRIDEALNVSLIFRPETLADTAHARAIEMPFDNVVLITSRDDELRLVCEDGRVFLLHNTKDNGIMSMPANLVASVSNSSGAGGGSSSGGVGGSDNLFTLFFVNAATNVYRRLHFQYPFFTFRHAEVAKLFEHYLQIDSNADGIISQEEFNASLGPILAQVRSVPKALYALCDCFARGKIRLFEYLHGFRVLLKGNYQDRVRYLFLLFDTKRQGSITYLQFLEGLKLLATTVELCIPKGESLESLTFRLFNEIDVNRDNSIQFEEFEHALKSNFGLMEVLRGAGSSAKKSREEAATEVVMNPARVLSFGHPQWIQICQILAGIEMSVTNPQAYRDAPDTPEAQSAKFTYNIPNSVSPSSTSSDASGRPSGLLRNPFAKAELVSFADYCPSTFEAVRKRFGITREDYLGSLGFTQAKRNLFLGCLSALYEMSSSGRSGSFFYASTNNRFILKTIPHAEAVTLRKMLPSYYQHVLQYPNTLLTRFCGLHALTRNGVKMIFVVMQNIFLNAVPIQETFDLKGSRINRSTPMELRHLGVALKDNDFEGRRLTINANTRQLLIAQLEADSKLLSRHNLNDYSFLLGIHKSLDGPLPPDDPSKSASAKYSAFQREYGGIASSRGDEVYFVGIIDCLTDYGIKKMSEHISKSVLYDSKQVSCVPPAEYHKRFIEYLSGVFVAGAAAAAASITMEDHSLLADDTVSVGGSDSGASPLSQNRRVSHS